MKPANRFNFRVTWHGVRRIGGREEASALVEFGLGWLFILGPMLVGIIYGAITLYDYEVLAYAVTNGAEALATGRVNNAVTGNQSPCTAAEQMVLTTASQHFSLNQSLITVEPPTFIGPNGTTATSTCPVTSGSTTTGGLNSGDFGILSATYPCAFYFPRLGINLCPMAQGSIKNSSGVVMTNCPYTSCVSAQITVRIE